MADTADKTKKRPLSPHLQVYRLPLTAILSISHRATGWFMAVGTIAVIWLLLAAATGPEAYDFFMSHAGAWYGRLLIFGWSAALFYHMCNGIRHLIWDAGYLLDLKNARRSSYAVLVAAITLTALVWYIACPFSNGG